ncbi:MAG: hypothetical protein ACTSRG_08810 [Candidatus Helarchaeota archaeon]
MMIPCFKCKNCKTNWVVDIYTDSKEGIIQNFISSTCCPICGKKNLRVCFIHKVEEGIRDRLHESVNYYDKISQSLI